VLTAASVLLLIVSAAAIGKVVAAPQNAAPKFDMAPDIVLDAPEASYYKIRDPLTFAASLLRSLAAPYVLLAAFDLTAAPALSTLLAPA